MGRGGSARGLEPDGYLHAGAIPVHNQVSRIAGTGSERHAQQVRRFGDLLGSDRTFAHVEVPDGAVDRGGEEYGARTA